MSSNTLMQLLVFLVVMAIFPFGPLALEPDTQFKAVLKYVMIVCYLYASLFGIGWPLLKKFIAWRRRENIGGSVKIRDESALH